MTAETPPRVTIIAAVLCDDIRREDNGKDILIGAYSSTILVHALPSSPLPLMCWLSLIIKEPGSLHLSFRATDHNRNAIFQHTINMGTDSDLGEGSFPLGPIFFQLKEPKGTIKIDYKEEQGEWINILEKNIMYRTR